MCKNDSSNNNITSFATTTSPDGGATDVSISSFNSSLGDNNNDENNDDERNNVIKTTQDPLASRQLLRKSSSIQEATWHGTTGTLASAATVVFSLYFPFILAPSAAFKTYQFAFWKYDEEISRFDNTIWTYGTDYLLAIGMILVALSIPCHRYSTFNHAGWRARGLLACYMLSVTAGGIAHQFYTTTESRNTYGFRFLWTICVGTVAAASGFMGAAASELVHLDHDRGLQVLIGDYELPVIPDWSWVAYAFFVTATVIGGAFSFQRPACDIFIAGITQFPSTFYMMLVLQSCLPKYKIKWYMRQLGCFGFILNAPLLPMYPLLVQYTGWTLATINTLLHTWLFVAWSIQGLVMRHIGECILRVEGLDDDSIITTLSKDKVKHA